MIELHTSFVSHYFSIIFVIISAVYYIIIIIIIDVNKHLLV